MKRLALIALFLAACNRSETPQVQQQAAPAPDPHVARGKELVVQYGCNVCHIIPTIEGPQGSLGPTLAGIASKPTLSNGVVQNTPANLAQFVQNPASLNPQSSMPPIGLPDSDASDIAAFLLTLE